MYYLLEQSNKRGWDEW